MFRISSIVKEIPVSQDSVIQVSNVPDEGFTLWIDNLDSDNAITYSIQDSPDGSTWTTRSFPTVDCDTVASSFILAPEATHSMRVAKSGQYSRLVASASSGTLAQINLTKKEESLLAGTTYLS